MTGQRRPALTNPRLDDRAWLDRRYTIEGATVADIAAEAGADPANVWRALHRHGIPLRGRPDVEDWASYLTPDILEPLLAEGMSASAIGRELGCSHSTVIEAMARHELIDTDPAEDRQLRRWYEYDGLTVTQIAGRLGVHPRTARKRLYAAGVTMRPRGRRPKP